MADSCLVEEAHLEGARSVCHGTGVPIDARHDRVPLPVSRGAIGQKRAAAADFA
jgi:hypothetical protein